MATLSERLAEKAKQNPNVKGQGRAAFLALKPEIKMALVEGWSAKEIWTLLKDEEKISISYSVFLRYIKAYGLKDVTKLQDVLAPTVIEAPQPPPTVEPLPAVKSVERSTGSTGFKISSEPDKGSLV